MKKYRVLHVPKNVGGNPEGLNRNLKVLGVNSTSLLLEQKYFGFPVDRIIWKDSDSLVTREVKRLAVLADAAMNYDIIHYNFGRTLSHPPSARWFGNRNNRGIRLLNFLAGAYMSISQWVELKLFKLLKKQLFIHYQGSDARPLAYTIGNYEKSLDVLLNKRRNLPAEQKRKLKRIMTIGRHCSGVYTVNPDLLHILPPGSRFIPYCHVDLEEWKPIYPSGSSDSPLIIGHAPTNRNLKGTQLIINAIQELKEEGYNFEFVLVEGRSNSDAKKIYEKIDVLIDQLFIGWYGGVAVEAMALGKPVLVYLRESDLKFIPNQMANDLPFIQVTPHTVKEGIRSVLEMPRTQLYSLGKKSRAFVETWHNATEIARQIKCDYERALQNIV